MGTGLPIFFFFVFGGGGGGGLDVGPQFQDQGMDPGYSGESANF